MATQRALVVQEIGKPLVVVHDRLLPEPGPGQLQIKVAVAGESNRRRNLAITSIRNLETMGVLTWGIGLNPHDQRSRDTGLLIADKLPAILSKDVVGVVSRVGDGMTKWFQVGDRVMSLGSGAVADSSQSGLQEYALADAENCAKIPDNISYDEAVRLPSAKAPGLRSPADNSI
jgi:NADPH2:quinone reductase